ncbi:MAG: hypothetical protein A2W26_08470 [Acidobacteria bacterium RBG_16_64_8]|nr:MAG: hypothetical protein A2W26_08470 [Acidobacteria bacterium RBG_16_64_8]
MGRDTVDKPAGAGDATQRQLEEMHKRVAQPDLLGPATDRELSEMKHRLIVDGASSVLFEKGFHRTSIRDIASACGMSMGQLYHYISSKDDLLYLMHRRMQERWLQHLADAGFEQITDPVARLEHGLRSSMSFLSQNRELLLFLYTETKYLDREHLRQVLDLDDQNVVGFYRHLLSEIPEIGLEERESDLAANLVAFMGVFLALRGWNLDLKNAAAVEAAMDFQVDFTFRALGIERKTGCAC